MVDYIINARKKVENIKNGGLSIYDKIDAGDERFWLLTEELEAILNEKLVGINLSGLALRTRSKVIKEEVCKALGYEVPKSFKKTQPRFLGQNFDVYGQKSNNLQVWNEEISPTRRYILIDISENDSIRMIKVVSGDMLSSLDRTGKLTQKYQALLKVGQSTTELVSKKDTKRLRDIVVDEANLVGVEPIDNPRIGSLLSIESIYNKLVPIVGTSFEDLGRDQERNRGAELQRLVCNCLGYTSYNDNGKLPDVRNQLLEVKLQTSPTIDLGAFKPDSDEALDVPQINGEIIRIKDIRYAIFNAIIEDGRVEIKNLYLVKGKQFFDRFQQMQGKEVNGKIQIPLPTNFFDQDIYEELLIAEDSEEYSQY